jgi:hypothetical protein
MCTMVAFVVLSDSPRVYSAQTDVVFLAPGNGAIRGLNDGLAQTLVDFAGLVGKKVTDGRPSLKLSSPSATLYGTGVREGVSISLADAGGQWGHMFNRPVLSVQVVDSSSEEVANVLNSIVRDISRTATTLQSETGAPSTDFITIETVPEAIEINSIGQTRTSVAKGLVALTIVGAGLTLGAAIWLDRSRREKRRGVAYVAA